MTKLKNTKKGMAKKALSVSLVAAMLATSNVPVWAAEDLFTDGSTAGVETFSADPVEEITSDTPALQAADYQASLNSSEISVVNGDITASFTGVAVGAGETGKYSVNWYITDQGESIASGTPLADVDAAYDFVGSSSPLAEGSISINFSSRNNQPTALTTADIGRYLSVVLYEQDEDGNWNTVTDSVSAQIVAGDASNYITAFTASAEWGQPLDKQTYRGNVSLQNATLDENSLKWMYNGSEVADGYLIQSGDIGKTYNLVGNITVAGTNIVFENVVLGTVSITSQTVDDTDIDSLIWANGVQTDAAGNPTYTYDGTAHYPRLETVILNDGTRIDASNATYTQLTVEQATIANAASGGVDYVATIPTSNHGTLTVSRKLIINPVNLSTAGNLTVSTGFEYSKNGVYTVVNEEDASNAGLAVTTGGNTLTLGTDYLVSVVASPSNAVGDNAQVTVTGNGNYTGTLRVQAPITAKELTEDNVEILNADDIVYDGNEKRPTVQVTDNGAALVANTDYTVSYSNNTEAGDATVTVRGIGNYTGTVNVTFEIQAASLADLKDLVEADFQNVDDTTYTGRAIDLVKDAYDGMRFVKNRDFTVEYVPQNINAGEVRVELHGINNYANADTESFTFTIARRNLNDEDIEVEINGLTYAQDITEAQIRNAITITYNGMTLIENTDYEILNITQNGNQVTLQLEGLGNYTGTRTATVRMAEKDINTVTLPRIEAQEYTGDEFTLHASDANGQTYLESNNEKVADFEITDGSYKLKLGTDYEVVNYENNRNVGTATINIVGRGSYTGTASISFPIVEQELTGSIVMNGSPIIPDQQYSYAKVSAYGGYTFEFSNTLSSNALTVVDTNGDPIPQSRYTVTYQNNTSAGTATITVEGVDGYDLYAVNTFRIVPAKLSSDDVDGSFGISNENEEHHYTGESIEPEVDVDLRDGSYRLVEGTDYEVVYSNNVNVGTAKVTLVGLGNYAGTMTEAEAEAANLTDTFAIQKTGIRPTDIAASDVPYAGGLLAGSDITITNRYSNQALVEDTDYTVEITEGGTNIGQVKAEIKLSTAAAANYEFTPTASTSSDTYEVTYNVVAQDLANVEISAIADQVATGGQIRPAIVVMNGQARMVEGYDYEVTYGENTEVGTGTVTITPVEGSTTYTGSQEVTFNIVEEAPEVGQAIISNVRVSGNTVTPILSGDVDGAVGYDYVISTSADVTDSASRVDVSKNILTTNTNFYYVEDGTYYVYCHAWKRDENGLKVFGEWSNVMEVEVTAITPERPMIQSARLSGRTLTVTWTRSENATGYDIVMGTAARKVNGEMRPVDYGKAVKKITNGDTVTVTFRSIPDGTYYVGLHAWNRTSESGTKVFSPWSNGRKIVVG